MNRRIWVILTAFLLPPHVVAAQSPPAVPTVAVEQLELPPLVFRSHAIAIQGQPKYDEGFKHFSYANPIAPKGGNLSLGVVGGFDSFNPFISRGRPGTGSGASVERLMVRNREEESAGAYGLVAETVEWPQDRAWLAFELRPEAKWHDGKPITVDDIIFSLQTLKSQGDPRYRRRYRAVLGARQIGERKVRFDFAGNAPAELPLLIGEMPILPKHYWQGRDFTEPTLIPPLGSGPYRIARFEPGRSVELERVEDYWGESLPVNVGHNNFDRIRYVYFPHMQALREGLKADQIDLTFETSLKAWAGAYQGPAQHSGWLKLEAVPHRQPVGFQGFVFNTRRAPFDDRRVRRALSLAFDFEWTRKILLFDHYDRTTSYFENSELAAKGLPSDAELKILEPYRGKIPDQVFVEAYRLPATDGSGWSRENRRRALELLSQAGWEVRDMKLVNRETDRPLEFEIVLSNRALLTVTRAFARNLGRLGIKAEVRALSKTLFEARMASFDFDMTSMALRQREPPGGELRDYWSSPAALQHGSRNLAGIVDPVIDELIELVIGAASRQSLIDRARALDRVLLWGHYVVPHFHSRTNQLVSWDKFGRPGPTRTGTGLDYWWFDKDKADALERARRNGWPDRRDSSHLRCGNARVVCAASGIWPGKG